MLSMFLEFHNKNLKNVANLTGTIMIDLKRSSQYRSVSSSTSDINISQVPPMILGYLSINHEILVEIIFREATYRAKRETNRAKDTVRPRCSPFWRMMVFTCWTKFTIPGPHEILAIQLPRSLRKHSFFLATA